jgi:hypothetical protein
MSPASVLGHEMGHATDPNYYENVRNKDSEDMMMQQNYMLSLK